MKTYVDIKTAPPSVNTAAFTLYTLEYMTEKETLSLLDISITTLKQWVRDYSISRYKIGDKAYYKKSEINKLIEMNEVKVDKYIPSFL